MASMAASDVRTAGGLGPRVRGAARAACRRALRWSCAALIAVAFALPTPSHAELPKGEATLSSSGKYARLLLKFDREVGTEVVVAGSILVIRFNGPVDIDIDHFRNAPRARRHDHNAISKKNGLGDAMRNEYDGLLFLGPYAH